MRTPHGSIPDAAMRRFVCYGAFCYGGGTLPDPSPFRLPVTTVPLAFFLVPRDLRPQKSGRNAWVRPGEENRE